MDFLLFIQGLTAMILEIFGSFLPVLLGKSLN